jgi:hypothetical protein
MISSFAPILAAARHMQGFPGRWFVSGGWAIDLFLGEVTRKHSDIEIGIDRADQHALFRHLIGWSLDKSIQTPALLKQQAGRIGARNPPVKRSINLI